MSLPALGFADPVVQEWFARSFAAPTDAQARAWAAIARGESTLLAAPTGSGKTLAAFLVAIDRLMFGPAAAQPGTRVLYISPLKALGVDVERNLSTPLAGIVEVARERGERPRVPSVGVRSGDTPARERVRLRTSPPDILITTPESLFLMLTSRARDTLHAVEVVIIDEIHALAGNKRGAHLMLSLERLEALRVGALPLQRIGLSATQRPLEEVARFLGGGIRTPSGYTARAVTCVDAGRGKRLELTVERPAVDALLSAPFEGAPNNQPVQNAQQAALHRCLLGWVQSHRSTLIFANSRRHAERLAIAINELAGSELVLAHHGSLAKEIRANIERRLKLGELPGIVATSSLELGIDMGAIDLVVQVESPPSVAAVLQRVGRAGHQVGAVSRGILCPRFPSELLACAAVVRQAEAGSVELTRILKNPLDVLAQHIVSMLVAGPLAVADVFAQVTGTAAFAELSRENFEGVLDMLSGRHASARFSDLAPRIRWERATGMLEARKSARLLSVMNAGTIIDRGYYAVYLFGAEPAVRVGELDEEMVFETSVGDVFLLGAASWRVDEIGLDRVWVSPAPGEPGRTPFWRGDKPARSFEFGKAVGALLRELSEQTEEGARQLLQEVYHLNTVAIEELLRHVRDQANKGRVPSDRCVVVESVRDEAGSWRVVVLSPFGGRVHAPWSMLVTARLRAEHGLHVDAVWTDEGLLFRLPGSEMPPPEHWFVPASDTVEEDLTRALADTPLFAAHFRENAARALLLPRARPGKRVPLWVQRRKARDLLAVAQEVPNFPIVLETYRECLLDVFDVANLAATLRGLETAEIALVACHNLAPSPFAAELLYRYAASFLYATDTPVAERRAQALQIDPRQLRALLGEPELRTLLDRDVIAQLALELRELDREPGVRTADDLQELLRRQGDLSLAELGGYAAVEAVGEWLTVLVNTGHVVELEWLNVARWVVVEDASRYRDALHVALPSSLPAVFTASAPKPLQDILHRYARRHMPFRAREVAERYALEVPEVEAALHALEADEHVVRGAFLPDGNGEEWCHTEVLRRLRRLSLERARQAVAPVSPARYTEFLLEHQHVTRPARGLDGVLSVIEQLQGVELPFEVWNQEIFPARVTTFMPSQLDELCAAGEVVWRGVESGADTRVAFYLADDYGLLAAPSGRAEGELCGRIRDLLTARGALFFTDVVAQLGGFPADTLQALWTLVWAGEVTNDTLLPLRGRLSAAGPVAARAQRKRPGGRAVPGSDFRSRRGSALLGVGLPGSEGRWTRLPAVTDGSALQLKRRAEQLLVRYGIVPREVVAAAFGAGGFAAAYPILAGLEDAGRVRRGSFVAELGPMQFALPPADSQVRAPRSAAPDAAAVILSALDPANPFGHVLPWPELSGLRSQRSAGTSVILWRGELLAYVGKGRRAVWTASDFEVREPALQAALVRALVAWFEAGSERAWLIEIINGERPDSETLNPGGRWLVSALLSTGFALSALGLQKRGTR